MKGKDDDSFLKRFGQGVLGAVQRQGMPLYGHKFSKKTYTLHQHVVLLCVREYLGMSYERFVEHLKDLDGLVSFLGLKSIPHFTTLQKVCARIKGSALESLYLQFASKGKIRASMDSTGVGLHHTTHYYEERLEHFRKRKRKKDGKHRVGRPRKKRKRKHQYINGCCDLDRQILLAIQTQRGSQSDNKKMIPTLKKMKKLFPRIVSLDADKGYDAEYNLSYVNDEMNAKPHIKVRNEDVPIHRTKGVNRKKAKKELHNKRGRPRKNHRNKSETIFSVIKKIFGENLTAKTAKMQRQQLRIRILAYNAYRKAKRVLQIIEHFYIAAA